MNHNLTNGQKQQQVSQMITGWKGDLPPTMQSVVVHGETLTLPEILSRLQTFQDLLVAPDRARVALQHAVAERRRGEQAGWTFLADLASIIRQQFPTVEGMAPFGLSPPAAPAKPSVETRTIANAKRQRTREARGVKGSRQRAAITTEPTYQVAILGLPDSGAPTPTESPPASAPPTSTP